MKFSEYVYERPDFKKIQDEFSKKIEQIKNATSIDVVIKLIDEINKLRCYVTTMESICSVRASVNTFDKFYEQEREFLDENLPLYADYENQFSIVLANSPYRKELETIIGKHFFNLVDVSLKTFNPIIIEDLQEENKLSSEYSKLKASAAIPFDGKILTLPQLVPYTENIDRNVRRAAEAAVSSFYQTNEDKFDDIYDRMVKVRDRIAKKLGYENFIQLAYYRLMRIDYDAKMVANYRKQVFDDLVPLVCDLIKEKGKRLGIDELKSYDLNLSFLSGNPNPKGDSTWQVEQAKKMYHEMSKETGEFFDFMIDHELMDLDSKPGKEGGGYCTFIKNYDSPFIFANFNGTSGDVGVLTHEAGHAFQVYSSRKYEVLEYLWPSYEAAEIHSMSMEFFAWPWMKLFFKEDTDKYYYSHLAESIIFIPYGVSVDEFQHEIYEHPEMSKAERKACWRRIEKKYLPYKKYDNEFLDQGTYWYRQGHIFNSPFYYIDYTLAQVCAHQFWIKDHENHENAWKDYKHLCSLGGSLSFLGLVKEANLKNPFVDGTVKYTVAPLAKWLKEFDQSKIK